MTLPAVIPLNPPSVTTQITQTMPLAQALQIGIQNAGKDPNEAWAVFDVKSAIIISEEPPKDFALYVVVFRDFSYCEVKITPGFDAANTGV